MAEPTWYDRLLSSIGYEALDVIFGVKADLLSEDDKKRLVYLGQLTNDNPDIAADVDKILIANNAESPSRKAALLIDYVRGLSRHE